LTRHIANSAGALRYPSARFDAARCGIAVYGISPFGTDPAEDGLEPALRWDSELAQVRQLQPGDSTGYGRRFVAERPTWIGIVPVGYADGFRRDLTGTEVRVAGEPRRVVGTISMDALAVELDRELPPGTPVTLLGHGVLAEAHARVAGTIGYELVTGIRSGPERARRSVVDS
ncbi:MAG TPA: alanine racemase C-terminal domain-containing protein, partial [Gaiellaceae bacterium]|nr:alanine racemase C-terminal domain-containing protein [Gaiellaceae bacterium]